MKCLGLDLGAERVKAVLIESGLFRPRVLAVAEADALGRSPAQAIEEVWAALGAEPKVVCVGLDRGACLHRTVTLPFDDADKVAKAAPFAAEDKFPVGLDRLRVGTLPPRALGRGSFAVAVHAAPREMVAGRLALAQGTQRTLVQLDAIGAAEALLASEAAPRPGEAVLLVDLGARKTCVEVVDVAGPRHSRCLRTGVARMAGATAEALGAGPEEVEASFRRHFLEAGGDPPKAAVEALDAVYADLASELDRTLLTMGAGEDPVTRVVVSGGGARARLLTTSLQARLGKPVEVLALPQVAAHAEGAERFATAFGLALQAADRGRIDLDLTGLPRESSWQDPVAVAVLGLCLLVSGVGLAGRLWLRAYRLERLTEDARAQVSRNLEAVRPGLDAAAIDRELASRRELLVAFKGANRSPLQVLDALAEALPVGGPLRFQRVLIDGKQVSVEATAPNFLQAQDFEEAVREQGGFAEVRMSEQRSGSGRVAPASGTRFTLEASLTEGFFR